MVATTERDDLGKGTSEVYLAGLVPRAFGRSIGNVSTRPASDWGILGAQDEIPQNQNHEHDPGDIGCSDSGKLETVG